MKNEEGLLHPGGVMGFDATFIKPSDYIRRMFNSGTTNDKIKAGYLNVDTQITNITPIYNWYVNNIENNFNSLSLTRNPILFLFIVDHFIINEAIDKFLYFQEGITKDRMISNPEDDLFALHKFANKNSIPGTDLILHSVSLSSIIELKEKIETDVIRKLEEQDKVILPFKYNQVDVNIYKQTFTGDDIKIRFPYGLDIFINTVRIDIMNMEDMAGVLDDAIIRCTETGLE